MWQRRFLTWGMLVTVFGMYYLFPLLIVSVATGLGLLDVMNLAIDSPTEYSHHLAAFAYADRCLRRHVFAHGVSELHSR